MAGIKTFERPSAAFVRQLVQTKNVTLDATSVDVGNTNQTNIHREGLILAYNTSTTNYTAFVQGGANGTDTAACILMVQEDTKEGDPTATAADQVVTVMWIGEAVSDHCPNYHADAIADLNIKAATGGIIEFASA